MYDDDDGDAVEEVRLSGGICELRTGNISKITCELKLKFN